MHWEDVGFVLAPTIADQAARRPVFDAIDAPGRLREDDEERMGTMIPEGGENDEAEHRSSPECMLRPPWGFLDWVALAGLAALTLVGYLAVIRFYGDALARLAVCGRLFQSDGWRVVADMLDFSANHYRAAVHPLFSVFTMPITNLMMGLFGTSRIGAIWVLNAATAVAWISLLYVTQRNLNCPRRGAFLVCLLAMASSGFIFWFPVPETYPLGSLSLLACFALAAVATRRPVSLAAIVAVGVFSAGVTITNWMAGLAVAASFKPPRSAAAAVALTLVVLAGGWSVQK